MPTIPVPEHGYWTRRDRENAQGDRPIKAANHMKALIETLNEAHVNIGHNFWDLISCTNCDGRGYVYVDPDNDEEETEGCDTCESTGTCMVCTLLYRSMV